MITASTAVLVLGFLLTACGKGPDADSGTIKIGAIFPLTGEGAAYGIPIKNGASLALGEINAAGGIKSRPVEIIWEDAKCTPKDAATAANKLISIDKVKVILGGVCSGETLGAAPIAEREKVILFSPASGSPEVTKAGDFVFRNFPSDTSSGGKMAVAAYQDMGYRKIALISENTDYAQGVGGIFKEKFAALGGKVAIEEKYDPQSSDFRTQVVKMKATGPDAFYFIPQTATKAGLLVRQIREAGVNLPLLTNEIVTAQEVLHEYEAALEGAVYAEPKFDPEAPKTKAFLAKYRETYGKDTEWGYYEPAAYDALHLLAEAISAVGEDTEKIKAYLYGVKGREGAAGLLTIDSNGDAEVEYVLKRIKNGERVAW